MANLRNRFPARRRFLKQSAALTATASLATSVLAIAQTKPPAEPAAGKDDLGRPADVKQPAQMPVRRRGGAA